MIGDLVEVETEKEKIKGLLLESYDPSVILLKLENGYNIGIARQNVKNIRLISKAKKEAKEKKEKQKKGLPTIGMIVTGGTISSRLDYKTGGVKWLMKPQQLFDISPGLFDIARIKKIERPFMIASENMSARNWKIIAKTAEKLLNENENRGIIITHGTDTLHYTAAALSFMLQNLNKPVVLTYSQRSTDRGSCDTVLNLTCAAHAALSNIAEVMIVGHASSSDNFCYAIRGTKTRKMHSSRRDTFRPINELPFAKIYEDGKIEIINKNFRKRQESKESKEKGKVFADTAFEEKIALIKFFPGMRAEQIDFFIKNKYKGLIIESTGLGHVATEEASYNLLPIIKKAIKKDIIVCFATQTIYGRLDPYVYSPGRKLLEAGVIFLEDMLAETAYVKLGWLLGHKYKKEEICELMRKNLVGEINEMISEKAFLY